MREHNLGRLECVQLVTLHLGPLQKLGHVLRLLVVWGGEWSGDAGDM